jgi:hypothetical protein
VLLNRVNTRVGQLNHLLNHDESLQQLVCKQVINCIDT